MKDILFRVVDDGDDEMGKYSENSTIVIHKAFNDMCSGGIFKNMALLEKEKERRGWVGEDNRTVKIKIIREYLTALLQHRNGRLFV